MRPPLQNAAEFSRPAWQPSKLELNRWLAVRPRSRAEVGSSLAIENETNKQNQTRMKTHRTSNLIRSVSAVAGGFALFTGPLQAAPFLYSPGDLVLAFRQTGSSSDLVVNIGKATNYHALAAATTININNLSAAQLNNAFPSLNGLKWSVAAANRPPLDPDYPEQTLWVTAPRADVNVQSPPWLRKGSALQGTSASQIDAIGVNAAASSSSQASNSNNTVTGVVIPVSSDYKLAPVIGGSGDYDFTFQGNVENLTPDDFDLDPENVTRSDLYELLPGSLAGGTYNTAGKYLGYFEFKPDGTLTFNTGAPLLPPPVITSVTRDGDVTTVSFTTVNGATYRLRATDAAGLNAGVSSWSNGASVAGDGNIQSLQENSAADIRFYSVEAQP
jgi:hypothetical protein